MKRRWNERGEIITDTTEIQRILRKYYEKLHAKKLDNLGTMDKFLELYSLPKLNQEEADHPNGSIKTNETEAANKSPGPDGFTGKFYQSLKE